MKSLFIVICIFTSLVSCKNDQTDTSYPATVSKEVKTLEGAWELVGFYNYVNNQITDSFTTQEGYRQIKMYTPTKVMWSKQVPSDSTEWFGYGTYKIEGDSLSEVLDYGSKMMSIIIQERKKFIYELDLYNDKFSQIEISEDGQRIYSENYKRIE